MVFINDISAKQILNSNGEPTIEATVLLSDGTSTTASVPRGRSRSSQESVELLDKDFSKYFGFSVQHAVEVVNQIIAPRLKKLDPAEQFKIDKILLELDGTPNKAHLGTNTMLAVSTAVMRAGALSKKIPLYKHINDLLTKVEVKNRFEEPVKLTDDLLTPGLPIPSFTMIEGGKHANSPLEIESYSIYPVGLDRMEAKIRAGTEIFNQVQRVVEKHGLQANGGIEGGLAGSFESPMIPMELISEAIQDTKYQIDNKILFGIEVAGGKVPDHFYHDMFIKYPIVSVTDPYVESNVQGFLDLNTSYPDIFIVGDDIVATQVLNLNRAADKQLIDGVVVKPNQIGTLTETLQFVKVAKDANITLFVSDRAGTTNDTFIVDFAIGVGAKFIKIGGPTRGERVVKYNYLLQIAELFEDPE